MQRAAAVEAMAVRAPVFFGALLLTFMLALGLRLYELGSTSLWADEFYTATRVDLDPLSMLETIATTGDNPPLSFVVIGLFVRLLGDSDFSYRLASAVLGSASVLLTYKVGEMLWTRKVGLIGSFLLAVNPLHIEYSQWARHYAITVFLVLLLLVLFLKALETGRKGHWLGFSFTAALSLYNQYFAFLALAVLAIYGFSVIAASAVARAKSSDSGDGTHASEHLPRPRRQARRLVCSLGLVALLFAPWLPSMETHIHGPVDWQGFGGPSAIQVHELSGYLRRWPIEYAGTDGPLALGFFLLAVLGLARSKREHAFFVVLWIGVPLLFSLTVASSKLAAPRYSLFVLPVYLLAVGRGGLSAVSLLQRGLRTIARKPHTAWPIATPLVVLGFAALSVTPLRAYYSRKPSEDWHVVSQYLTDNMLPGDIILADGVGYGGVVDSPRTAMALLHYLPMYGTTGTPVLEVRRGLYEDLAVMGERDRRVWAALWGPRLRGARAAAQYDSVVNLPGVLLIGPLEPSGDVVEDAASTLNVLLHLMPSETGRFDVHLALVSIYMATGRFEDAQAELKSARAARPHRLRASADLLAFERRVLPPQDMANPTRCTFGGVVALIGYEVNTAPIESAQSVDVTLWWQALADMERDYTAFVHLTDHQGRILAQEDRLLQRDDLFSSLWLIGSVAREEYRVQLGADTTPGDYVVKIGVYYWATGERLPVWDEQGRRQPEDTVSLGMAQ